MTPDYKARKRGEPTLPIKERLYSNVVVNPVSGCWEWNGTKYHGYGRICVGSRVDGTRHTVHTHRLSYELNFGPIPDGMEICHKCDNPSCINPEHLFIGTRQDNVNDRERKGRNVVLVGEERLEAKLTRKDVKNARWERAFMGTSFSILAKKYGVCKKTIQNAINGVTWKCVSYMPQPPEKG
jgi:hypothetical protein